MKQDSDLSKQKHLERKLKLQRWRARLAWTGFQGKTLWDWLGLLISATIPIALAIAGFWFGDLQMRTQLEVEAERQREALLQDYLETMGRLLMEEGLRTSGPEDEVRDFARARTLATLRALDGRRNSLVVRFLFESSIFKVPGEGESIFDLSYADLRGVDLREAFLWHTFFWGANMTGTRMTGADLWRAHLNETILEEADLRGSDLNEADFTNADLREAKLQQADLTRAKLDSTRLNNADLSGADLEGVEGIFAGLQDAKINGANLCGAKLVAGQLQNADLQDANLNGAILVQANLEGANVTQEQLVVAWGLRFAIMPDGSSYDGRYNLRGDLSSAARNEFNLQDAQSMAEFYGVNLETYQAGQAWAQTNLDTVLGDQQMDFICHLEADKFDF